MADNPSMTDYGLSFIAICAIMWFVPEPKLSAVCGLLILIGWDITFHLREIIALQKEQLHEHRVTKLTADKIEEYTTLYKTLAERTLVMQREVFAQSKEILAHSKEKLAHDKEKLTQKNETLAGYKEIVAMQKEILGPRKERYGQVKAELAQEKETIKQYKEIVTVHKEVLAQCKEMLGLQRRLVPTAERSVDLQLRIGDMLVVQLRQLDVLLRKLGVEERPFIK